MRSRSLYGAFREVMMKLRLALVLAVLCAGSLHAVTIGVLPAGGRTALTVNETATVTTIVNSSYPATGNGTVTRASVVWMSGPSSPFGGCPDAFRIKFLRPSTSGPFTLTVTADLGPFTALDGLNVITLSPPVAVETGDMIALTSLKGFLSCGGVASIRAPQTTAFFISGGNPGVAAVLSDLQLERGFVPSVRASSDASVIHGYIPVVGSVTGTFGSSFKTAVQLTNRSFGLATGKLVFHPAGAQGSSSDPGLDFLLSSGDTIAFDDVVGALGRTGLGSMDVVVTDGPAPDISIHVFDDQGAGGTAGFTTEAVMASEALQSFSFATLTAPSDPANFRLNIGIRTLDQGATFRFSATDAFGIFAGQGTTMTLPPNSFEQNTAAAYLGRAVPANGLITVFVSSGSAFVYGATTDNRTNDARIRLFVPQ